MTTLAPSLPLRSTMPQSFSLYRLAGPTTAPQLEALQWPRFKPLSDDNSHAQRSIGWDHGDGSAVSQYRDLCRLRLLVDEKRVPAPVIERALERRIQSLPPDGQPITRKLRAELRREVELDLLPQTFPRLRAIALYIRADGLCLIGSASAAACDTVIASLLAVAGEGAQVERVGMRDFGDRLAAVLRDPEQWLDDRTTIGHSAQFVGAPLDPGGSKQAVTCRGSDLGSTRVLEHLEALGAVRALGLSVALPEVATEDGSTVGFDCVLTDELRVKSMKWSAAPASAQTPPGLLDIRDASHLLHSLWPLVQRLQTPDANGDAGDATA